MSFKTVANWLNIFDRLYATFRLSPFGAAKIRAVKKEQKHYHFDWSLIKDNGARFENLVACHLIKWVHFCEDTRGDDIELRYFRDVDGREIDFIIVKDKRPVIAIECKYDDAPIDRGLIYFSERFPKCHCWQISAKGNKDYVNASGIRVCPSIKFLSDLI